MMTALWCALAVFHVALLVAFVGLVARAGKQERESRNECLRLAKVGDGLAMELRDLRAHHATESARARVLSQAMQRALYDRGVELTRVVFGSEEGRVTVSIELDHQPPLSLPLASC